MPLPKLTKKVGLVAGAAVAAAVTIGVATYDADPSMETIENVDMIKVNPSRVSPSRVPSKPLPPQASDFDGDGVQDTLDHCPWNAGDASPDADSPGCP